MTRITIPAREGSHVKLLPGQTLTLINTHGTQVIDFWALTPPSHLALSRPPAPSATASTPPRSFIRSSPSSSPPAPSTPHPYPFATGMQYLSMSRTRSVLMKLVPSARTHDALYSNKCTPLLTLLADTTPHGIHDTIFGCCDRFRYRDLLAVTAADYDYAHASCAENLHLQLRASGLAGCVSDEWTPDPFNVFMNVPVSALGDRTDGGEGERGGAMRSEPPRCQEGGRLVLRAETEVWCYMSACPNDVIPGVNAGRCVDVEVEVGEA